MRVIVNNRKGDAGHNETEKVEIEIPNDPTILPLQNNCIAKQTKSVLNKINFIYGFGKTHPFYSIKGQWENEKDKEGKEKCTIILKK